MLFCFRFSFARSSGHVCLAFAWRYTYTLISTSTPLGNSSFMSASMVFDEEE